MRNSGQRLVSSYLLSFIKYWMPWTMYFGHLLRCLSHNLCAVSINFLRLILININSTLFCFFCIILFSAAKYDVAISTACAGLDYIVVETTAAAQACVELLRSKSLGVATFMILVYVSFNLLLLYGMGL